MPNFVRMSSNFVNLGRLYSLPPRRAVRLLEKTGTRKNRVASHENTQPAGWGYFEDGSVFISSKHWWLEQDAFEARMNMVNPFVQNCWLLSNKNPPQKLSRIRKEDITQKRLIVISKGRPTKAIARIPTRNARDGDRIVVENPPFKQTDLSLDKTGSYTVAAEPHGDAIIPSYTHRRAILMAMKTFRGTLIEGVLQPNVRLGGGIRLSTSIKIRRELIPREIESDKKERRLLLFRQQVVRLAKAMTRGKPTRPLQDTFPRFQKEIQAVKGDTYAKHRIKKRASSRKPGTSEVKRSERVEFSIQNPTPPESLMRLRSRTAPPKVRRASSRNRHFTQGTRFYQ